MLTRMGSGLAALTIIILSLVPGKMRPHVLGNDFREHFVAYFFMAGLLAIGYLRPMQMLSRGVLLTICAGSLEFVQLWIPGRTASAGGFADQHDWCVDRSPAHSRRQTSSRTRVCRLLQVSRTALQNCDG